jgi:hypothetical protein
MDFWDLRGGATAELGALGTETDGGAVEKKFVRQYFDNGLAVYDAAGTRFGIVADYDRPGGGFVVHVAEPSAGLYLPMRLVREVRRGKVYLSELARNLTSRPLDEAPRVCEARPLLSRVLRLLSGRTRIEEVTA